MKIYGYKLEFPQTWTNHGQARIICYVSDEIKYTRTIFANNDHIPSITWKNGVTGEGDNNSQLAHLKQHISQWQELVDTGRNFVALGDANLCAKSWNENNFRYKELANEVQNFLLCETCSQIVNKFTRVQNAVFLKYIQQQIVIIFPSWLLSLVEK